MAANDDRDRLLLDDAEAGEAAAAMLGAPLLDALVDEVLARLEDMPWDLPPLLLAVVPSDVAVALEEIDVDALDVDEGVAAALRHGMSVSAEGVSQGYAVLPMPLEVDGHVADALEGVTVPAAAAAVVLVIESWVSQISDAPPVEGRRGPDGRVEARIVSVVTRTGVESHAVVGRDSGDPVRFTATAEEALRPYASPRGRQDTSIGSRLAGRVTDRLRRTLGLPTSPPWPDPAEWMVGWWANFVSQLMPEDLEDRRTFERSVPLLLPDRVTLPELLENGELGRLLQLEHPRNGDAPWLSLAELVRAHRDDPDIVDKAVALRLTSAATVLDRGWDAVADLAVAVGAADPATVNWFGGELLANDVLGYDPGWHEPGGVDLMAWARAQVADCAPPLQLALEGSLRFAEAARVWRDGGEPDDGLLDCSDLLAEVGGL